MLKKFLDFSNTPVYLKTRHNQLEVIAKENNRCLSKVSIEDIGTIILANKQITITTALLSKFGEFGVSVIVVGENFAPIFVATPTFSHTNIVTRANLQMNLSVPKKKQLWKKIIFEKIQNQALCLEMLKLEEFSKLIAISKTIKSDDSTNREAYAAKVYWKALNKVYGIKRDSKSVDEFNSLLNYAYSIFRGSIARSIYAYGLLPMIGVKHCHPSNALALADDLIEPLRPIVDRSALAFFATKEYKHFDSVKHKIAELLYLTVIFNGNKSPLDIAIQKYVYSLIPYFEGKEANLIYPQWDGKSVRNK